MKLRNWTLKLMIPGLLLAGCTASGAITPTVGDGNSSDGKVTVEGKAYTESDVRNSIQCYKNSSNQAAKVIAPQYEQTLTASTALKGQGLNAQFEANLSALVQSMIFFDRANNEVNCIS